MSKAKPANPAYPDADPTAPGGMSQKALVAELVAKHGHNKVSAEQMSWPEMIDAVVQGRLAREAEQTEVVADETWDREWQDEPAAVAEDEDDFSDIDDLLAEFEEPAPPCEGCLDQNCTECYEDVKISPGPHPLAKPDPLHGRDVKFLGAQSGRLSPLFIGLPGSKDYIFDGHRGAGPSAAERWMACTASLGAARAFLETLTPNQQAQYASGNTAARQGTTAHAAAEVEARVVLGELTPEEAETSLLELAIMPDVEGEAYDDEMGEYITEYIDLVKSYVDTGREVLIEHRVTATIPLLTFTDGEQDVYDIEGSLDLGVMPTEEEPVLVVGDLKYGEGIDVDVERNPQIRIYALGLLALIVELYGCLPEWLTTATYHIVQPRLGGIKTWTESIDDLLEWQDEVLSKALTEALGGAKAGAAFNPGEVQCQWCPVRGSCPALTTQRVEAAAELFDVITEAEFEDGPGSFPETHTLSNEALGSLYSQIVGLTKMAGEMKDELQRRLYRGQQVPGFTLVNYTPPRKWKGEATEELDPVNGEHGRLDQGVAASLWQSKLLTPTAAEKLLGEDYAKIADLVDRPDKRPVIAPEGDRRSAWEGKPPEAMFEVE